MWLTSACCCQVLCDQFPQRYPPVVLPQVAIADMDLKPLEKIGEHSELDCAIMYQAKRQRLASLLS